MDIRTSLNYNLCALYDHLAVETVKMLEPNSTFSTKFAFFTFAILTVSPGSENVKIIVDLAIKLSFKYYKMGFLRINNFDQKLKF